MLYLFILLSLSSSCGHHAPAIPEPAPSPNAEATPKPEPAPFKAPQPPGPEPRRHDYPGADEKGCLRADADFSASGQMRIANAPNATPQIVCYRIMGPAKGVRIKDEQSPAIGDLDGLVRALTKGTQTDREKAESLFDFVVNDIKDWYYPAQGLDLTVEDLSVLIWNFGFGFCYDLGRLQAGLWKTAGLRSRIVGWPQHTLAEVYYDGGWHLYDLQHRSFYVKPDGQVASFAEIRDNPSLLNQGLDSYGLDPIGYPPHHLAHWYSIAAPKFEDSNDGPHWKTDKDFSFDLRFGEFFEIVYSEPTVTYHPDSWTQYYGEMTLRKEPPWPVQGRLTYAPSYLKGKARWRRARTPDDKPGYAIEMDSPFIFTEGWIKVKAHTVFRRIWVQVWDQTYFVGRLVGGNAIFSKYIAGSNHFRIIVDGSDRDSAEALGLSPAVVETRLQLSPIGLPQLRPGVNQVPVIFDEGRPHLTLWYLHNAPDLVLTSIRTIPQSPIVGETTKVEVKVSNLGTGANQPCDLRVFNSTTALLSETIEPIGTITLPSLQPNQTRVLSFEWEANTRMSWYGQNPHVQLMDAWIDLAGNCADANRDNNRLQQVVVLRPEPGASTQLPGYTPLPGVPDAH